MIIDVDVAEPAAADAPPSVTLRAEGQPERRLDITHFDRPSLPAATRLANDLLLISAAAYAADKIVPRWSTSNKWTRDIDLRVPVSSVTQWNNASEILIETLSFLSGDRWTFQFHRQRSDFEPADQTKEPSGVFAPDAVSLFSGGLDSLCGVIDRLETSRDKLLLVGHFDSNVPGPRSDQLRLFPLLVEQYKEDRIHRLMTRVAIAPAGSEITLRGRSFLFVALAAYAASSYGADIPIIIPENGIIALNPPLTPSRRGSCSTRTTHPYFLDRFGQLLKQIGIENPVETPLMMKTKRQVVEECENQELLAECLPHAVSCAKRNRRAHWQRTHGVTHCGYCLPCIFRRTALDGGDFDERYGLDLGRNEIDIDSPRMTPDDLRAVVSFVRKCHDLNDAVQILRNAGGLISSQCDQFAPVVLRAADEIRDLLRNHASVTIRRRAGIN